MLLHLHPVRSEALTVSERALIRWSIEDQAAIKLVEYTSAEWQLHRPMYIQDGRETQLGGVTGAPDGQMFAMEQPNPQGWRRRNPCVLELRRWDDFSPMQTIPLPDSTCELTSLDTSPDGRWLVAETTARIFLVDRHTGSVSHVFYGGEYTFGLTFDPTSTVVAGIRSTAGGGSLRLWRLDPVERYVPHPRSDWERQFAPPDRVSGSVVLTDMYGALDRTDIQGPHCDIGDAEGTVAFTPDGRIVIFSVRSVYSRDNLDLSAYEVASGRRLWAAQGDDDLSSRLVLTPDGQRLIAPTWRGDLLVYRTENGILEYRLPTGLSAPVQALAFDHDGRTLWLATEDQLIPFQLRQ